MIFILQFYDVCVPFLSLSRIVWFILHFREDFINHLDILLAHDLQKALITIIDNNNSEASTQFRYI